MTMQADRDDTIRATVMTGEKPWFDARRASMTAGDPPLAAAMAEHPRVGLALSGGGIRSATFSLGVLQALSRAGCLRGVDYLSTVSGGSYIGAFFGALFIAPQDRYGASLGAAERREFLADPLGCERGQKATARLREFGRYLTPGGMSDLTFGASLVARNWLAVQVVLGFVPLAVFLALRCIAGAAVHGERDRSMFVTSGASILLAGALAVWCLGCGIGAGYWFSHKDRAVHSRVRRIATPLFVAVFGATALAAWRFGLRDLLWITGLAIPALAILSYTIALVLYGRPAAAPDASAHARALAALQAEDKVRARMTRWLADANAALGALLMLAAITLLGERLLHTVMNAQQAWQNVLFRNARSNFWAATGEFLLHFWPLLVAVAPLAFTVWAHRALRRGTGRGWLARPSGQAMLGFSILLLWLAVWAAIAAAIATAIDEWSGVAKIGVLLAVAGIIAMQGLMYGFLNLSSLVTLYSARLKRAYIGASNPAPAAGGYDVDRPGDLVPMDTYYGQPALAPGMQAALVHARPLHLINATIAQTAPEGASNVVAYDRKGKPLHLSPAGIVCGTLAGGNGTFKPYSEGEDLTLSDWTAISGAAASTAIGSMSSVGLSVLAMMTNVRLGYWWKIDRNDARRWPRGPSDTVLGYLYSEMAMRFDTSRRSQRRWYLTDGGHFENTGAYALLQRGLEFIVVSDNGADPDYRADDLMRLLQRARTDLGAEIDFLDATQLNHVLGTQGDVRDLFGAYDQLITPPDSNRKGGPYAALARIRYRRSAVAPGGHDGWLMLIKPRLNFTEPPELLAYSQKEAGQRFPQQTTLDQFFDEDQWEAYRRFGEVVGERLFKARADAPANEWRPGDFLRLQTGLP